MCRYVRARARVRVHVCACVRAYACARVRVCVCVTHTLSALNEQVVDTINTLLHEGLSTATFMVTHLIKVSA